MILNSLITMKQEHAIFKTIVEVSNQRECNRTLDICKKYELPTWTNTSVAFEYVDYEDNPTYLQYQGKNRADDEDHIGFYIDCLDADKDEDDYNIVSLEDFEQLAYDYVNPNNNLEYIMSKFNETLKEILNNK